MPVVINSASTGIGSSKFLTSLFLIALGIGFLAFAYKTMYEAHATFSFVLVVVGIAILLYGTGTQGAGNFESDAGAVTFKIGIAGGAGILALCVGWGLLNYSTQMRTAFEIERRYVRISLVPLPGPSALKFSRYAPNVTTSGGEIVPTLWRGNIVEIYVPYLPTEQSKILEVKLVDVSPSDRTEQLRPVYENQFSLEIKPGGFGGTVGGLDFPVFAGKITARRGLNGAGAPQVLDDAITVDLIDPAGLQREQTRLDSNQPSNRNTQDAPPPPIFPGAM